MKLKHNKKRNTAFLFETLVRELTRSAIRKDTPTRQKVVNIIKESFDKNSLLHKELELYRTLCETRDVSKDIAEKILQECKKQYNELDKKKIFSEQGATISKINKSLSKEFFNTFVPNYKDLATVYQIFNTEMSPSTRVLLEDTVVKSMTGQAADKEDVAVQADNLVIKNFIKKFNGKYGDTLSENQSKLLKNYVMSFTDNAVSLKSFLNEEITRLRTSLEKNKEMGEIRNDADMVNKTDRVLKSLEEFKNTKITKESLSHILNVQNLVREIEDNG
mgnify:CR=1 FL=1